MYNEIASTPSTVRVNTTGYILKSRVPLYGGMASALITWLSLAYLYICSETEVITIQDSPPGGTVACPGDRIVYRCNTTGTEAVMIWQVCDHPELIVEFYQLQNEANITLQLPDGGIAECSFHKDGTFIVSTLTMVAPINVTSICFICYSDTASLKFDENRQKVTTSLVKGIPSTPIDVNFDGTLSFSWNISSDHCIDNYTLVTDGTESTHLSGNATMVRFNSSYLNKAHTFTLWASNCYGSTRFYFNQLHAVRSTPSTVHHKFTISLVLAILSITTCLIVFIKISIFIACKCTHCSDGQKCRLPLSRERLSFFLQASVSFLSLKRCPPLSRKYLSFFLQVSVSFFSFVNIFHLPVYFYNQEDTVWCTVVGGFLHLGLVSTTAVTALIGACDILNDQPLVEKLSHHVYIVVSIVVGCVAIVPSMGSLVVPIMTHSYGNSGSWCWICSDSLPGTLNGDLNSTFNGDLNSTFVWMWRTPSLSIGGFIQQMVLGYVPVIFIGMVPFAFLIKNRKKPASENEPFDVTVGVHSLLFTVSNFVGLADRITTKVLGISFGLKMVHAIINSVWPLSVIVSTWFQQLYRQCKERFCKEQHGST